MMRMMNLSTTRRLVLLGTLLTLLALMLLALPGRADASTYAKVRLISLECITTEDSTGADEPFLRINGVKVWAGSLNDGQSTSLSGVPSYTFSSSVRIDLYDADAGTWYDGHDLLGRNYVYASQVGQGQQEAYYTEDGAFYILNYEIVP